MTWPGITRTRCTSPPSTSSPLAELRSTSSMPWSTSTRACRFDTSGSASTTSAPAVRPITLCPRRSGNSRPASGPLCTCMSRPRTLAADRAARRGATTAALKPGADRGVADEQLGVEHDGLVRRRRRHRERERAARCAGRCADAGSFSAIARATSLDRRGRVRRHDDVDRGAALASQSELELHRAYLPGRLTNCGRRAAPGRPVGTGVRTPGSSGRYAAVGARSRCRCATSGR